MKAKAGEILRSILIAFIASSTSIVAVTITGTFNTFETRQVVSAQAMNENFALLKAAVESAAHGNQTAPVGAVIAWHKTFTGTPSIPDGWLECNGQIVNDSASPYPGQTLPGLNGQARFLRAGRYPEFSKHRTFNRTAIATSRSFARLIPARLTIASPVFPVQELRRPRQRETRPLRAAAKRDRFCFC